NPPYYMALIEAAGYQKAKDFYAWHYQVGKVPRSVTEMANALRNRSEVKIRSVNPKKFREELGTILEIFNDAWSENWGFVPLTEPEIEKAAQDLKHLIDPEIA